MKIYVMLMKAKWVKATIPAKLKIAVKTKVAPLCRVAADLTPLGQRR
jgi:hypothetical protein